MVLDLIKVVALGGFVIISSVNRIDELDVEGYSWRRLAQFLNTDYTAKLISNLHQLDKKHASNAKKQAEQIKYCLVQAKEYYEASKNVTLATKPVMLYYCLMSLALAEILLKQNADSRLAALRAHHNCHGLTFSLAAEVGDNDPLSVALEKMFAKPQVNASGQARGTFEVWRRSAREYPTAGYRTELHGAAATKRFSVLFFPEDKPPPSLPNVGVNLSQCLTNLPYMADALARWGMKLRMIRTTVSSEVERLSKGETLSIIVHPTSDELFDTFGSLCRLDPSLVNQLDVIDLPGGCIVKWPNSGLHMALPHSTCINSEDTYFTCSSENLGEFGYLYLALHMLGNFARYYPDRWLRLIEQNSPLANIAEDLCRNALTRLPLLALSELSRSYLVVER